MNKEIKNKLQRGLALTVKESQDLYKYIKTLEQESILDKIKAEIDAWIELYDVPFEIDGGLDESCRKGLYRTKKIINKYKGESEVKNEN